jgi:quercetin dioxygenase-like cupin family protein
MANPGQRGTRVPLRPRLAGRSAAAVCAVAIGLMSGPASATPGRGVSVRTLTQGTTDGPVTVTTTQPATVLARTITIAPGGSTGWHYHPGRIIGVVVSGTLTRSLAGRNGTCRTLTSRPGDAFVEEGGNGHVHNGRNLGKTPVVLHATYILSPNSPASVDANDPGCAR